MSFFSSRFVATSFFSKWQDPAIQGALFKISSCLCFSTVNGIVRYLSLCAKNQGYTEIPAAQLAFFETFIGLLLVVAVFSFQKNLKFSTHQAGLHFLRAIVASLGIIFWFTSLGKMPILQVVSFKYIAPIFTILGAKLFLSERVGLARSLAIGLAFSGALLATWHQFTEQTLNWTEVSLLAMFPILATMCYAASGVFAKKIVKFDSPQLTTFYLLLFSSPILFIVALPQWVTPEYWQIPWLLAMGTLLATAYTLLNNAYVVVDLTFLVPMSFTRLVAGAAIGMIFFNEWPPFTAWIGSSLILLATVLLCNYEVQKKKAKDIAPDTKQPIAA